MCELLWSDPQPQCGRSMSKRGVGTQFGPDVTKRFLQKNKLDYVIRSHEVKHEGYEVAHDGKCITVFSAPNYWYVCYFIKIEHWQLMRLSNRRPVKAQASLRICAVMPEPSLFAHMKYGIRRRVQPKIRPVAPLDGCACAFEEQVYGGQKVP